MQKVSVCPNPYHYVDADGVPMGVYPEEPAFAGGARRWVGASLCPARTKVLRERDAKTEQAHEQVTVFMFDMKAHDRPFSSHYLQGVRSGALLAADEATARAAGVKDPMSLDKALEREKARAAAKHCAHKGKDAKLQEPPKPLDSKG